MFLPRTTYCSLFLLAAVGAIVFSCSSDEDDLRPPPALPNIINVEFENARVIEVNSARHWALLLHTGEGTPGTAIQLVDLSARSLVASRILTDYLDVYDIKFVRDTLACFAGRPHGHIGYAVQFFSLPSLTMTQSMRVMVTSDTSGNAGFLAVDSAGTFVYYSHAGGSDNDGLYKIRVSNRQVVDADNDGQPPSALDNDLVSGLFAGPGKLFYDDAAAKIVVANPAFITFINSGVWGTLSRADNLTFPVSGTSQLTTQAGANADMMAYGADTYVFGGGSANQPKLSLFRIASNALDLQVSLPHVSWWRNNSAISIHPRVDIVSVFVLREDSAGVGIGQYRLNNLVEVADSPYRTRTIPDSAISTFGLEIVSDKLVIADSRQPRLELISIR